MEKSASSQRFSRARVEVASRTVKTQWSNRSVVAEDAELVASMVPSSIQPSQFRSSIAHAAASPRSRQRNASRSPPTWSPCLPTSTSKRRTVTSTPGRAPARRRRPSGMSVACGESIAPAAIVRPCRSAERPHATAASRHDVRDAIAIGVAHGDGAAAVARSPLRVEPRERRVPGDVDRAGQQAVVLHPRSSCRTPRPSARPARRRSRG